MVTACLLCSSFFLIVPQTNSTCTVEELIEALTEKETKLSSGIATFELLLDEAQENLFPVEAGTSVSLRFMWQGGDKFVLSRTTEEGEERIIASDGKHVLTEGNTLWDYAYLYHFHNPNLDNDPLLRRFESEMALLTEVLLGHLMPVARIPLLADRTTDLVASRLLFRERKGALVPDPGRAASFFQENMVLEEAPTEGGQEKGLSFVSIDDPWLCSMTLFKEEDSCSLSRLLFTYPHGEAELSYCGDSVPGSLPASVAHGTYHADASALSWTSQLRSFAVWDAAQNSYEFYDLTNCEVKDIPGDGSILSMQGLENLDLLSAYGKSDYISFDWKGAYQLSTLQHVDLQLRSFLIGLFDANSLSTELMIDTVTDYKGATFEHYLMGWPMYIYLGICLIGVLIAVYFLIQLKRIMWGTREG
ncbi:MAG: hypothetical protein ACOYI9_11145 [Candidatus Hydrogenedentales bacterium]|jgi:hypothetical protein